MTQVLSSEQRLILAAANLYRTNPVAYTDFVNAARQHAESGAQAMVGCDPAELRRLQGRAQALASLAKLFSEAPITGPKVEEKLRS